MSYVLLSLALVGIVASAIIGSWPAWLLFTVADFAALALIRYENLPKKK